MRKLRRIVARYKMRRAGYIRLNKYGFFAKNWRKALTLKRFTA